jgi:O-antigen ligase
LSRQDKRKVIHRNIFLGTSVVLAFAIPVWKGLLPLLIVFMVVNWLAEGAYIRNFPLIFKDQKRFFIFSFSFLYFLYLAGLAYTSNLVYGTEDLQMKLSLLIFPLIFATSDFPLFSEKETGIILKAFAAGCIAGSFILLGRAFYFRVFMHEPDAFYYTKLGWNFHPSYYSMYLAFAVSNILSFQFMRLGVKITLNLVMHVLLLLFFTLMIVLLSSKSGFLVWLLVLAFYAFLIFVRYRQKITGVSLVLSALCIFVFFNIVFPHATSRLASMKMESVSTDAIDDAGRSTSERIIIWKSAAHVIKQNFLFGVGTGDVRDKLTEEYENEHVLAELIHYRNAHNQYFQTWIALGILGLLLLAFMIIRPAVYAIRQEHHIYFIFLFIVGFSMLFESMFERQEGVVFYVFFNTLLFTTQGKNPE